MVPLAAIALGCVVDGAIQSKMRGVIAISRADVARTRVGITLVVLNKNKVDIILIIKYRKFRCIN